MKVQKVARNERPVDEKLAALIRELNAAGIKTVASCEGHGKEAYIAIDLDSLLLVRTAPGNAERAIPATLVIDWRPTWAKEQQ